MLSVLNTSKTYTRPGKRECSHKLPLSDRNKAIIYLLLDTGVRASELGNIRIHHVDVRNRRITVMGKGSKQWHKFNRYVKKGEKGIPILAPLMFRVDPDDPDNKSTELGGFKVVYVFDVSQTDGEPLPDPPEWKSPHRNAELNRMLTESAISHNIVVLEKEQPGDVQGINLKRTVENDPASRTIT